MLDSRFPEITRDSGPRVELAVERTGRRMEAGAKQRAAVDTGFMRGEIQWLAGPGPYEGQLVAGANYSHFVDGGTRYMAARPFMAPAAEEQREQFAIDVAQAWG